MRITIKQKKIFITPALRIYINRKIIQPLAKLLTGVGDDLPRLDVEVGRSTQHHNKGRIYFAEANLSLGKILLRARATREDIHSAIDALKDEIEVKTKKFKARRTALVRRGARRVKRELRYDESARFNRKGRIRNEGY